MLFKTVFESMDKLFGNIFDSKKEENINKYEKVDVIRERALEIMMAPTVKIFVDYGNEIDAVKIAMREYEEGFLVNRNKEKN